MAYVGITADLRQQVRNSIEGRRRTELSALPNNVNELKSVIAANPLMEKRVSERLNDRFQWAYPSISNWDRRLFIPISITKNQGTPTQLSIGLTVGPVPVCVLACIGQDSSYLNTPTVLMLAESHQDIPELAQLFEREEEAREINQRWDEIRDRVAAFLCQCKSLNEAVKLWPGIAQYVPAGYIQRVEEKRGPLKKGPNVEAIKALEAIDKNKVAQSNVLARFAEADKNSSS